MGNSGTKRRATKRSPKGVQTIGPLDVTLLANEYGVSYEAATYRLNSTRHVNRKEMEQLLDQSDFSDKALNLLHDRINSLDDKRKDRDLVCTIVMLTIRALQNQLISRSELIQIADELDKPWKDFLDF